MSFVVVTKTLLERPLFFQFLIKVLLMFKQILYSALALIWICALATTSPAHAQDNPEPGDPLVYDEVGLKVPGLTLLDVPPNSFDVPATSATLYIDTLYLYEYHFMLWGRVVYGNRVRPLKLTATFFDSALNTDEPDKSATAFDAMGNFEVFQVAVRSNSPNYMFVTGDELPVRGSEHVWMI